jgi:hypothetical protein
MEANAPGPGEKEIARQAARNASHTDSDIV